MNKLFEGVATALVTPFNDDLSINYNKLKDLIELQIEAQIPAIVICGTTGESATLSFEEKIELIKKSVELAKGRCKIIAGTGSNCTKDAILLSKAAESCGADALLIVTPYYNKCSQEGLIVHYSEIANNVSIPIIMYNVPSRTGVNILPKTVLELSKVNNICGLKEASSNISQIADILSLVPSDFSIYSGNDDQILPILSIGGKGVISVLSNIIPKEAKAICDNFFNGNISKSRNLQLEYLPLIRTLFSDVNPIPIKAIMNNEGLSVGECRLPLTKYSGEIATLGIGL